MRNMDHSLGDGGMPLLEQLGLSFERYGEGWAEATWTPTDLACNPLGIGARRCVRRGARRGDELRDQQRAGVGRPGRQPSTSRTRPAAPPTAGAELTVRGEVVQLTKSVAYVESIISNPANDEIVSRAMATFALRRADRPTG